MNCSTSPGWSRRTLAALVFAYFLIFTLLEYHRYLNFELYEVNDTAANMQTVWSLVHPPIFTTTIQEYLLPIPHNVLGDQLYFTLALYLPFWLIFRTPFIFVIVTLAAMAAAAVPLFGYARQKGLPDWVALLAAGTFLFNPICFGTYFRFGFRPECLVIPFLLGSWYCLEGRKFLAAELLLMLVLLTKHDSVILLVGLGSYLLVFKPGFRRFGAINLALGIIYYAAVVRPLFAHFAYSPTAHFKTLAPWGDTAGQALLNLFLHPGLIIAQVSGPELRLLLMMLGSVGLLCLLSPLFLAAVPIIIINFLGNDYYSLDSGWHWASVVPVLYLAAVDGLARARKMTSSPKWLWLGLAAAASILVWEGVWTARFALDQRNFAATKEKVDTREILRAIKQIEPEASVSITYRQLWFVAFRRQVFSDGARMHLDVDYLVVSRSLYPEMEQVTDQALIRELSNEKSLIFTDFEPVVSDPGIIIFKRKNTAAPITRPQP